MAKQKKTSAKAAPKDRVYITDTVLRDAHQSLLATRMRTEDMLPICEKLDSIGFWSLEVWGGATFDACVRFLKEDPWERLRKLREAMPNTRLQMLLRGQNLLGYRHYSDDVVREFVKRAADNGIDVFRIFDALNDIRNIKVAIESVKAQNKHAQPAICYTTSPVHTLEQFVKQAKELESMGADSIAIKDMAGLLTPNATANLVAALVSEIKVPVQVHSHATAGIDSMCQFKAVENGCRHIGTAISTLSGGTGSSISSGATSVSIVPTTVPIATVSPPGTIIFKRPAASASISRVRSMSWLLRSHGARYWTSALCPDSPLVSRATAPIPSL